MRGMTQSAVMFAVRPSVYATCTRNFSANLSSHDHLDSEHFCFLAVRLSKFVFFFCVGEVRFKKTNCMIEKTERP